MSLNLLKMLDRGRREVTLEEFKRRYRKDRVANQIAYFFDHAAQSAAEARRFRAATWVSVGFASLLNAWFVSERARDREPGPGTVETMAGAGRLDRLSNGDGRRCAPGGERLRSPEGAV